ncbi:Ent-kaur-16-ene synthase protein [Thalictrum thalictroides]|uniref:Ent-kaur-16-ene synthase protein n=1 Tax=Thalictrum thalictroides TaxID=46969 RepID=A0A7J6VGF6_THATH|nr:Ent-kaur-16-ene synthase protein [Thalictrum thalictroides]
MFNKVEISVSSYDTAWVAMVPSKDSPGSPYFPQCINWLLENQHPDGSWGLPRHHRLLVKDTLLSTLASILALKTWNIGEDHVNKGLHYITSTFASTTTDEKQHNPIGGSVCNSEGSKLYLAYVAEGLGNSPDWKNIMKYQRKNGSLFNSPSTTAAAVAQLHDNNCLNYLCLLLDRFGNAVPTVYPREIYTKLCMVDSLENLGIARHFKEEIKSVLDKTYRYF